MQDGHPGRQPRHSDGGATLPPASTSRGGRKGSRRKSKGLGTISAPLTPHAGVEGLVDLHSPNQQQQQQQHHHQQQQQQQQQQQAKGTNKPPHSSPAAVTPSRLGRRNTQSDTGQPQQQQQQKQKQVYLQQQHSFCSSECSTGDGPIQPGGSSSMQQQSATSNGPKALKQLQWQQHPVAPVYQQPPLQQQQQPLPPMLAGPPPPAGPPALPQGPFSTGAPTAATGAAAAAAAAAASVVPRVGTLQHAGSLEGPWLDPPPTLWEFFYAEATPHEKYPTADVLWRQTERDRVYNFLLYVPYQLERIMIFGTLLCLYSFLGALTALPLRCLWALCQMLTNLLLPGRRSRQPGSSGSSSSSRPSLLPGAQLYDLLCVLLMLAAVAVLSRIRPGVLYYWMKDITSEFLKIQVLFTALEILDKILSNFGVDVLEALSSTCTLYTQSSIGTMQLASDLLVAFLLITAHGSVLMCQAMVFAVTMNSKRNALLALMIATNFVELKGQVYKRTDTNKLWGLACQDIVERFQLLLVLCFVVVEDISNSGTWWPAPGTLLECGRIFIWEIVIDITKHAVLGKFNDIRPGIYKEYMRDLCSDSLDKHSHNTHKLVGFCPLGPAALSLRMVHTLFTLKGDGRPDWHLRAAVLLASWVAACATQVVLGYSLKWLAYLYVRHHTLQAGGKALPRAINVTPSGVKLFAPSGVSATVSSAAKGPSAAAAAAAAGAVGGGTFGGAGSAGAATPTGAAGVQTPSLSPLNPSFSPKGSVPARVVTAGLAASGTQTHGGSPTYSPKGSSSSSSVPQLLSAQLQVPGTLFNGGTGLVAAGRPSSRVDQLSSSLQGASSGPQHYPGAASADPLKVRSGPLQHLQPGVLSAVQLTTSPLVVGTGSDSSTSSSIGTVGGFVNGLNEGAIQTHPALIAASLAAPAAASANISIPAAAAAASGAAAAPDLQTLSLPPRLGISLTQRAGSTPDSAFSPGSQLQPFADQPAHMRASVSNGGSGWDTSAGAATTVAATMPSTDGSSVAAVGGAAAVSAAGPSSGAGTAGVAGGAAARPVSVIAGSKAAASGAHSSSYSELSAAGLFDRGPLKQQQGNGTDRGVQQEQQQQEHGWQQPKHRHRAKRE